MPQRKIKDVCKNNVSGALYGVVGGCKDVVFSLLYVVARMIWVVARALLGSCWAVLGGCQTISCFKHKECGSTHLYLEA